jgi:hypothetical protein
VRRRHATAAAQGPAARALGDRAGRGLRLLAWLLSVPMHRSYAYGYTHPGEDAIMIFSTAMLAAHAIGLFFVLRRKAAFSTINPGDAAFNALIVLVGLPICLFVLCVIALG